MPERHRHRRDRRHAVDNPSGHLLRPPVLRPRSGMVFPARQKKVAPGDGPASGSAGAPTRATDMKRTVCNRPADRGPVRLRDPGAGLSAAGRTRSGDLSPGRRLWVRVRRLQPDRPRWAGKPGVWRPQAPGLIRHERWLQNRDLRATIANVVAARLPSSKSSTASCSQRLAPPLRRPHRATLNRLPVAQLWSRVTAMWTHAPTAPRSASAHWEIDLFGRSCSRPVQGGVRTVSRH